MIFKNVGNCYLFLKKDAIINNFLIAYKKGLYLHN